MKPEKNIRKQANHTYENEIQQNEKRKRGNWKLKMEQLTWKFESKVSKPFYFQGRESLAPPQHTDSHPAPDRYRAHVP